MDTNLLSEKFKLIRSKEDKENDLLFKEIRLAANNSTKEFYNEEDILGMCIVSVLKKSPWLNSENDEDFHNVRNFVMLLLDEIKDTPLKWDDIAFYELASIIIQLSSDKEVSKMGIFDKFYSIVNLETWEALKDVPDFENTEDAEKYAKENNINIDIENAILLKRIGTIIKLNK